LLYKFSYKYKYALKKFFSSAVISQLLSVPPFFCGVISTLFVAILSDRKRIRGPFIIVSSFIGMIGYILLSVPSSSIAGRKFIYVIFLTNCKEIKLYCFCI